MALFLFFVAASSFFFALLLLGLARPLLVDLFRRLTGSGLAWMACSECRQVTLHTKQ